MGFNSGFKGLIKVSNIKCHGNPSGWSWALPCGRMDMTKLTVTFRNCFATAPKKGTVSSSTNNRNDREQIAEANTRLAASWCVLESLDCVTYIYACPVCCCATCRTQLYYQYSLSKQRTKDVSNDNRLLAQNAVYPGTFRDYVLILTQTNVLCAVGLSVSTEKCSLWTRSVPSTIVLPCCYQRATWCSVLQWIPCRSTGSSY